MAETDLTSKSENIKTDDKKPTESNSADNQSESKFKVPFFISSGIVVALFFTLISVLYIQHKSVQQIDYYEENIVKVLPPQEETDNVIIVNINTADIKELTLLPGIGESRAKDIIAYRNEYGIFTAPEDLLKIRGIGEATVEGLIPYIVFGAPD